jgi:hypothetical protein
MEISAMYLVYKHTSPSGKSYIGITKNYKARCRQHREARSGCLIFKAAIQLYGWDNFTHDILIDNLTLDEANTLEQFYIKENNTLSPGGYNLTAGGGGCTPSEETRTKMSMAGTGRERTEETKSKISAANKGKTLSPESIAKRTAARKDYKMSDESKAKLSAANKGKTLTDEHKAKIATAGKNRPVSDETRAKISASLKARRKM